MTDDDWGLTDDKWRMTLVKLELTRDISIYLGKVLKKKVAILLDFIQITSPLPHFGQLVQLFF